MQIWRLIAHHADRNTAVDWFRRSSKIAIGWGKIGDLRRANVDAPARIGDLIRRAYLKLKNARLGGPSLWGLYHGMRTGDLVIISDGRRRRMVMRITGDYEFSPVPSPVEPGDYLHQRPANYDESNADRLWQSCGGAKALAPGENIRRTLVQLRGPIRWAKPDTAEKRI